MAVLKKTSVVLLALTLGLAACGGKGGGEVSGEGKVLADAIVGQITADTTPGNPFAKTEDAQCFANALVSGIGLERLNALGLTAENVSGADTVIGQLTADEQGKIADAALGCIDLKQSIIDGAVSSGMTEAQGKCLADGMTPDILKKTFLSGMGGEAFDPTSDPAFMAAITKCFTG
jgi:hypothetical protein